MTEVSLVRASRRKNPACAMLAAPDDHLFIVATEDSDPAARGAGLVALLPATLRHALA